MAESIPQLRRLLNDATARIRELESKPPVTVEVVKEVMVSGPERVVVKEVITPGPERVEYRDRVVKVPVAMPAEVVTITREVIKEVPGPVEVKTVFVEVEKIVEVVKEVPGPEVVRVVEIKTPDLTPQTERLVYTDNPDHIETIKKLQDKICQLSSQLDLQRIQLQSVQA